MLAKLSLIVASLLLLSVVVRAQTPEEDAQTPETKGTSLSMQPDKNTVQPVQLDGLWPSAKLMDLVLTRWADRVSSEYELDEAQRAKVGKAVAKRWGGFLKENRPKIQPLVTDYLEMRLGMEPPGAERVQAWAKQATPLFERLRKQLDQGTTEFREILNPVQRAKFELQALKLGAGMQIAEQKLKQWQDGDFKVNEFWEPTADKRRESRTEHLPDRADHEQTADGHAADFSPGGPGEPELARPRDLKVAARKPEAQQDQIALELAAWQKYVEEFIRMYDLDEGQRNAVLSCLSELKERALAHRDRRHDDITRLEQRIESFTGSEEELAELKQQLVELYGPIDDMFEELKSRIEQVPTAPQRAAVARSGE